MQIPANKNRVPIVVIIGLILIVLLAMAIANVAGSEDVDAHQRLYLYTGLLICCLYYTALSFADYWWTLFNPHAILSIGSEGISDNLSLFSCGNIQWSEITEIEIKQALKTNFLVIHVRNADGLIALQSK